MPKFAGACCCEECIFLSDSFTRDVSNIDPDGVNILDDDTYSSIGSDWHVDLTTDKLVCDTTNADILFYDSAVGKYYDVDVECTLTNVGDYAAIIFGGQEVRLTATSSTVATLAFGANSITIDSISLPYTTTFFASIISDADTTEYSVDVLSMGVGFHQTLTCQVYELTGAPFTTYGLKATAGVTFDNLVVSRSRADCITQPCRYCGHACFPLDLPTTMSISVGGLSDTQGWCGPTALDVPVDECINLADCLNAATDCIEEGDCYSSYYTCVGEWVLANGSCVGTGNCSVGNGEWVIDRDIGADCSDSCGYTTTFDVTTNDLDYPTCTVVTNEFYYAVDLSMIASNCIGEMGGYITVTSSIADGLWTTEALTAEEICAGGAFTLTTLPTPGIVKYADELNACILNPNTCWGVDAFVCSFDDEVTLGPYGDCTTCAPAEHNIVTMSDLTIPAAV